MSLKPYTRFQLAENQLKTAIGLFLTGGDMFSVISLAGAADVILSRLVINSGKENFTEFALSQVIKKGTQPVTREVFGKGINDMFFINQIKHMDEDDDGFIDMDPEECAGAAIAKALANYIELPDHQKDIVQAFRAWARLNLDPKKYNVNGDPNWKPQGS